MTAAAKAGKFLQSSIAALKRCATQNRAAQNSATRNLAPGSRSAAFSNRRLSAWPKPCSSTAVLALISLTCLLTFPSPLSARSWKIADFSDTITVEADGSTAVHERVTLDFAGSFQGIHRIIPVQYPGPRETNYTLFVTVTGITDGGGNKLKYESRTSRN